MQSTRYTQVEAVLVKRGFGTLFGKSATSEIYRLSPQERFRLAIEELGGGFVLLGQLLRYRIDLAPVSYAKALIKLRDVGTPLPFSEFKAVLTKQYSRPLATIFYSIQEKPWQTDVITQSHEAITTQQEKVIIKIIKPHVRQQLKEDVAIMKYLAKKLTIPLPSKHIIAELEQYIKQKMDLTLEEAFLTHSQKKYASTYYPHVHKALSSKQLLVLSYEKKKSTTTIEKRLDHLQQEVHIIQGEFIIASIGLLLVSIGLFLPAPFSTIFIISSMLCFLLVFILLAQHPQ
jgi:ubiquinone biosynthesis protein